MPGTDSQLSTNPAQTGGPTELDQISLQNMVNTDLDQLETDIFEAAILGAQALQQIENTKLSRTPTKSLSI